MVETIRKLVVLGFVIFVGPGTIVQLLTGLCASLMFFAVQMYARPLCDDVDGMRKLAEIYLALATDISLCAEILAAACSALVTIFIGCILLKVRAPMDVIEETMARSMWSKFYWVVHDPRDAHGDYDRSPADSAGVAAELGLELHHLRMRGVRNSLYAPLLDVEHATTISHVWATGQDQARGIKELLKQSLPG